MTTFHRLLIADLEADRALQLSIVANPPAPELVAGARERASTFLAAIGRTLARFEGPEAAQRYIEQHATAGVLAPNSTRMEA
ncbi:hypothetical protein ABZ953_06605 [Streptomyces sp. NPDC046465]|uniref:hypothetical protein n=1 Tax=Streptomyces sp. NPDC046465 TaxID=3155810 RepID=UPI003406B7F3